MKNILEPVFEAGFFPVSYGFRPGKSVHGALEHLRVLLDPKQTREASGAEYRSGYQWAIEGDIKGCFDNISHHGLMVRIRRRIGDAKVNRLVVAFLKAGIFSEDQFLRSESGCPQGGILSPLLANIALSVIEERYERYVWPRRIPTALSDPLRIGKRARNARYKDTRRGHVVYVPIRYADDFIILVGAPPGPEHNERAQRAALREKEALAAFLREELHLELSETKTLVTPVTGKLRFLGHKVCVRNQPSRLTCTILIPRQRSQRLRKTVKGLFTRSTVNSTLDERLKLLNPVLRGWSNFYRYAFGAGRVFGAIEHYVWWTIYRWLRKKHPRASVAYLRRRYGWREPGRRGLHWRGERITAYRIARQRVQRFRFAWLKPPSFAQTCGEPGA